MLGLLLLKLLVQGSVRELMLVFELKLIEELLILALEQLADVKHFKLLRLVFTLMAFR
ncbi:hypothetical protein ACB092_02G154800 [Castanea dentata]